MSADGYPEYRWLERGTGLPVVFLHGLMGQITHWASAVETLGRVSRAIALELPIFHPALPEATIEELTAHTHRFLDAMGIPRAIVGGNSLGGHIALGLALAHPERVAGLILTGSSGLFERGFTRGVPHRPSADYVREKMQEIFFDPTLVTPEWVEEIRALVTTPASALRVLHFARAAKRHRLEAYLPRIRVPALLVWGAEDRVTPPEVARQFHALLPNSTLVFLPRCGHVPMLERPEAFNAAAMTWLADGHGQPAEERAMARAGP